METIRNTASDLWGMWTVRLAVLAISLGFVPFYFLSMAAEALR